MVNQANTGTHCNSKSVMGALPHHNDVVMPLRKPTVDHSNLTSSETNVSPRTSLHQASHYNKDQSLPDSDYQNPDSAKITEHAMKGVHHLSKLKGLRSSENGSSSVNPEKSHTQLNNDSSYSKD